MLYALILGPLCGSISGLAEILAEERLYKRVSIRKLLVLRLAYAVLLMTVFMVMSYAVLAKGYFGLEVTLIEFAFDDGSFAFYLYLLVADFIMTVFIQVDMMLGHGKLGDVIRGKYYTPREEERIFMFLDLKSSTQLAEKLGHIKYSMLLQDCFNDLSVTAENDAEIYQYVGDEAVLTWNLEDGLRNHNCLQAYFNFKKRLADRDAYYLQNYNCKPFFKAGLNAGIVTATEVGKYKVELAYHGDTINLAARIQGKCNEYKQGLLLSAYLRDLLSASPYAFDKLGCIELKGKAKSVLLYAASVA